jgi:hypothetical protein
MLNWLHIYFNYTDKFFIPRVIQDPMLMHSEVQALLQRMYTLWKAQLERTWGECCSSSPPQTATTYIYVHIKQPWWQGALVFKPTWLVWTKWHKTNKPITNFYTWNLMFMKFAWTFNNNNKIWTFNGWFLYHIEISWKFSHFIL